MELLIDGKWIGSPERHEKGRAEAIARFERVKQVIEINRRLRQKEDRDGKADDVRGWRKDHGEVRS